MITLLAKVWFDLWGDKSRTLQVALVIAIGSIGIGLVVGARNLILAAANTSNATAEPATIRLLTDPLTRPQLEGIKQIDGVWQVEGLYTETVEWRLTDEDEWQTASLKGRDDYTAQLMNLDALLEGTFPSQNKVGIGKLSVGTPMLSMGDTVQLRFEGREVAYPIVGVLDPIGPEPIFGETIYADGETYKSITGLDTYNLIQLRDRTWDLSVAENTDRDLSTYLEELNVEGFGFSFPFQDRIIPPDVTSATPILNALFLLLGIIGAVVAFLSIFLVYSSVSAIITQQTNQIGIMKAIGASSLQVVWSYLLLVICYGLLAMVISVPIASVAALGLQNLFVTLLNIESNPIRADLTAVVIQIIICIVVPLLAALIPLVAGIRITVREAISTYGLTGALGFINRIIAKFRNIPYTIALTIGNTFRNQWRVIVIQITLITAGTIFMMVLGVNDASRFTYDDKLKGVHNYQVALETKEETSVNRLETVALSVSGVESVESWQVSRARARPISQTDAAVTDARGTVFGQPPETDLYLPELVEGRWLQAGDSYVVVAGRQISEKEGWSVGDQIRLTNSDLQELTVQIVGIHFDPADGTSLHIPLSVLQAEWAGNGMANSVWIRTTQTDAAFQKDVARDVKSAYEREGIDIEPKSPYADGENTIAEISERLAVGVSVIVVLLIIMAVLIALIGGVGLSGVLSLSVLERRREIGVMRAIGASSGQVIRLFVGEGLILGWLSWLIAIPLSIPAAYFLTTEVLPGVLNANLAYRFTVSGLLIWFVIVTVLAIIASALPARSAAKVSVRESLSYS